MIVIVIVIAIVIVTKAKAMAAERPFWVSEVIRQLEGYVSVVILRAMATAW